MIQREQLTPGYPMLRRTEPTRPPTTPLSACSVRRWVFMYSCNAGASRKMGRVWSQTRPGPVRAARKMPSPPKIMFLMHSVDEKVEQKVQRKAPTRQGGKH